MSKISKFLHFRSKKYNAFYNNNKTTFIYCHSFITPFSQSASYSTFEAVNPTHPTWRHCAKQNTFLLGPVRIGKTRNKATCLVRKRPGALETINRTSKIRVKNGCRSMERLERGFYRNFLCRQTNRKKGNTGQDGTLVVGRVEEAKFIRMIINDICDWKYFSVRYTQVTHFSVRYTRVTHFLQIGFFVGGFSGMNCQHNKLACEAAHIQSYSLCNPPPSGLMFLWVALLKSASVEMSFHSLESLHYVES